ncbi:hypothetical protein [Brevundimonas sp. UBA7664]|uniref:hypothetical protein n=1 Tax=Brevundimonas sp. UBA7664 TaxID=1946141 RepID=UPI0025BD01BB|nr:hypothetical protein [Brevundimonas sp. UBA7664]
MIAATGRPDYDASVKLATLTPQEPIFVLRAGDMCAPAAVRAWAALAHAAETPIAALELALQQADRMEKWPTRKRPDGPDLTHDQAKQLEYQFQRRAWATRDAVPSVDIVMAEQLGRSAVVGPLRSILSEYEAALEAESDLGPPLRRLFALVGRDYDALEARLEVLNSPAAAG